MPSKVILHGGFNKINGPIQQDDAFYSEIIKDAPAEAKVLLVYFAERLEKIPTEIDQNKTEFNKNAGTKKCVFKIATEESFIDDCKWADVIYLHGGKTVKIMETLNKFTNLKELFLNKTLAGDSAGANSLCRWFYSKSTQQIGEGLGILPFKIVVHYEDGTTNPLQAVQPELETVFLREYETRVFYLTDLKS